jgi:hypothetical protein
MKVGAHLIWAVVAGAAGIFVLLGYFTNIEFIEAMRLVLMRWAVLIAAWALILGIFNILYVHFIKVRDMEAGWPYSIVLMIALFATMFFGALSVDNEIIVMIFNYIHLPIETSLMALLAISLVVAGFRLVTQKRDWTSMVFVGTAFFVLLGTLQWPLITTEMYEVLSAIRNFLVQVLASGGARGILLGVALGAIVTGVRVLLAVDRPYGD